VKKVALRWAQEPVAEEFRGAELGDRRREKRLVGIATQVADKPEAGFPQIVASDSDLEGLYRFLRNEWITPDAILGPHLQATRERARQVGTVLVVHDTTDFAFGGQSKRKGLGRLSGKQQGFLGHVALMVVPGEERLPLGVAGIIRLTRKEKDGADTDNPSWYQRSKDPERESLRWEKLVTEVEQSRQGFECIHVMDREGDAYDLLSSMIGQNARFVVRASHDRALAEKGKLLHDVLDELTPLGQRTIELNSRPDKNKGPQKTLRHPPREGRKAQVAVACTTVRLRRTQGAHTKRPELKVNVVHVWEPSPPEGQPAVQWTLYTTEPIETLEQVWKVVDSYRSRWVIEELFKALKTGCNIERRQMETFHSLANALSIFLPIACKMLLARSLVRAAPKASALQVLSAVQLHLLKDYLKLSRAPKTAEEALFAVAKIGGHLRRNGPPGWQTLGRGFEALIWMQMGWLAAKSSNSDQS